MRRDFSTQQSASFCHIDLSDRVEVGFLRAFRQLLLLRIQNLSNWFCQLRLCQFVLVAVEWHTHCKSDVCTLIQSYLYPLKEEVYFLEWSSYNNRLSNIPPPLLEVIDLFLLLHSPMILSVAYASKLESMESFRDDQKHTILPINLSLLFHLLLILCFRLFMQGLTFLAAHHQ